MPLPSLGGRAAYFFAASKSPDLDEQRNLGGLYRFHGPLFFLGEPFHRLNDHEKNAGDDEKVESNYPAGCLRFSKTLEVFQYRLRQLVAVVVQVIAWRDERQHACFFEKVIGGERWGLRQLL